MAVLLTWGGIEDEKSWLLVQMTQSKNLEAITIVAVQ